MININSNNIFLLIKVKLKEDSTPEKDECSLCPLENEVKQILGFATMNRH